MNKFEQLVNEYVDNNEVESKTIREILSEFVSENKYRIREICDFENHIEDVKFQYELNELHSFELTDEDCEKIIRVFDKYLDNNDNYWDSYWASMNNAIETVLHNKLKDFIREKLKEILWLDGRSNNFDEDEIEDIANDLKPDFETSEWGKQYTGKKYDDWYDCFIDDCVIPTLKEISDEQ